MIRTNFNLAMKYLRTTYTTTQHHLMCYYFSFYSTVVGRGSYVCPYCSLDGLTEDELWRHTPAYHINSHGKHHTKCPICRNHTSQKPLQVHIHDDHGPIARARRGRPIEEQASIRCYSFSLVVCRHPITGCYCVLFSFYSFD